MKPWFQSKERQEALWVFGNTGRIRLSSSAGPLHREAALFFGAIDYLPEAEFGEKGTYSAMLPQLILKC